MRTTVTKYLCLILLFAAALFWREGNTFRVLLNSAICAGAIVVLQQASTLKNNYWVAAFALVALAFNPVAPLHSGNAALFLLFVGLAIVTFGASLFLLKPHSVLSIPSITGRTPGSESL